MDVTEYRSRLAAASARIRELEDVEQIRALNRTYLRNLADRRWGAMLDDFTADAVVSIRSHGERRGREELAALFGAMHAAGSPPDAYLLTSPVVTVSGDEGEAAWTWHRHFTELPVMGGAVRITGPWWEGRYRCGYRRDGERWRFSAMHFRLVAPEGDADVDAVLGVHPKGVLR